MCGRTGFIAPKDEVEVWKRYQLNNKPKLQTTYNLAPTMKGLVIHRNSPNMGEYLPFGVPAPWNPKYPLINAQAESVAEKRTFKELFENYRCIIPASFYFEWKVNEDKTKSPYLLRVKDVPYFSFAGIYKPAEGYIIITTQPNAVQIPIHHRMPVILDPEFEDEWLNPDNDTDRLLSLLAPYPAELMEAYEVGKLVNSPRNQTSEIIKPV